MPRVSPFGALTYDVGAAGPLGRLTAPPYDVISDPRRDRLRASTPYNVIHLDLAEGSDDPREPGNRYDRAATLLRDWRRCGALVRDARPAYRAYEMRYRLDGEARRTRGLLCAMELEPWGGAVLPHEDTMPGPVADRLRLLRATRTHLSAVYGTVAGPCDGLADLLDRVTAGPADATVVDDEEVTHRIWRVAADVPADRWLADERLLIADGHHRYTTALAYRDERHAADGPGPWDRILTLVVDAGTEHVPVLPYHRVQRAGAPPEGGDAVGDLATLLRLLDDRRLRYGTVSRAPGGDVTYRVHGLAGRPPTVRALHEQVLDRAVPEDALGFTHDAGDADAAVRAGDAVGAYLLPPTTPERIAGVVERGERLPRKSTFFWPKPRTGMVLMPLDEDPAAGA